ncbi:MAG TPA: alanine racemase [Streptosporangiaceae bacterium]|nr:alanine racemase [Streptosporangiaceae bacterium]
MNASAETLIDLDAVMGNVTALRQHVGGPAVMAVVKSDGYGHGMVPAARAALAGGASWIGVIDVREALALRAAGVPAPVLCLMGVPGAAHEEAVRHGVDLSAGTVGLVGEIAAAARQAGRPARLHLKVDTGMSRGGATARTWPDVVAAALAAEAAGEVAIIGIFSHLACADIPGHPSIDSQVAAFRDALAVAEKAGAQPELRHLANTPATLTLPQTWFDLVRTGGGIYGLSTLPGGPPGWLRPAMTVRARLIQVKQVAAGAGVSYGHRYVTSGPATLGLVPIGYADGVPRGASGVADVQIRGRRRLIAGTVCMNQFVVDFGAEAAQEGDEVVLFGPGDAGEPTPQDWADALGTISYEIVTRFGGRTPRSYFGVAYERDSLHAGAGTEAPGRIPAPPA